MPKIYIPKEMLNFLYWRKMMPASKISLIYRCNAETVRRRMIEYDIKRRKQHQRKLKINKNKLLRLYFKEKMSLHEIAKEYRCSAESVRKLMIKFNIERRDTNEYHKWKCPPNQVKPIIDTSPILSYILGVLVGDGWTYKYKYNYFIGLDSIEKDFCIEFLNALKQISLNPSLIYRGKRGWRTVACSKIFFTWYRFLTFDDIKDIATKYPIQFLKGFHESEGSIYINQTHNGKYRRPVITIVNTNKSLIDLTKSLLEDLNFHPTLNLRYQMPPRSLQWAVNLCRKQEVLRFLSETNPVIKNLNTLKISY